MDSVAFFGSIYGFGVLGLFGITLLPFRAARLLWQHVGLLRSRSINQLLYVLVGLAAVITLVGASFCTFHVARCLMGYWCTADRSGGWLYLVGVGFWYAAFEVFAFVSFFVASKLGGQQPNYALKRTVRDEVSR
jgi:uncharacterized membrane protein